MRILYLSPSGQIGGAERVLLDIFGCLREAKPDWQLELIASDDGPLIREARVFGVHAQVCRFPTSLSKLGDTQTPGKSNGIYVSAKLWLQLAKSAPAIQRYVQALRALVQQIQPNIIHTNGLKMHIPGIWLSQKKIPVVWHIHEYIGSRPITSRLLRAYSGRCSAIIVNSRSVEQDVKKTCGNHIPIRIILNAVDLKRFAPDGETLDLDLRAGVKAIMPGTTRIGLVGTFGIWKGHKIFLNALALLPRDMQFRGYIIGAPVYQTNGSQLSMQELREHAIQLGLEDKIVFTGFLDDIPAVLRSLDILVHASTQPEPFGLIIVEAMACGKAVIASEAGGAAEIIQHGENAIGFSPGDEKALAQAILKLIDDPQTRARLGTAGRKTAEMLFDRSRFTEELIPLYNEIT